MDISSPGPSTYRTHEAITASEWEERGSDFEQAFEASIMLDEANAELVRRKNFDANGHPNLEADKEDGIAKCKALIEAIKLSLETEHDRTVKGGRQQKTAALVAVIADAAGPCSVFLAMKNLAASEIGIVFVGEQDEYSHGANDKLEISARGELRKVPLAVLGLIDRHAGGLNGEGDILLKIARKAKVPNTNANVAKMTRLKKALYAHLGIRGTLFESYRRAAGWVPLFALSDNRGAADRRAKHKAEFKQPSLEQMTARGYQYSDPDESRYDEPDMDDDPDNADADKWMERKGHNWTADTDPGDDE